LKLFAVIFKLLNYSVIDKTKIALKRKTSGVYNTYIK